jgi:hypothetical protein
MQCRRAQSAIVERRLGLLEPVEAWALEAHVGSCRACAAEAAFEDRLAADLALLGEEYPLRIDVHARVMRDVRSAGTPSREEVTDRQLAWGSVAAVAAFGALALFGWWASPALMTGFRGLRALLGGAATLVRELSGPAFDVLAIPFRFLAALLHNLAPSTSALPGLIGVTLVAGVVLCGLMMLTGVWVAGRELLRAAPAAAHEETWR